MKKNLVTAINILVVLLGFVGASMLFDGLLQKPILFKRTWRLKEEIRSYSLFDPLNKDQDKHVLLSSCFTINNIAYNVKGEEGEVVRHGTAYLGQMMNFLLKREYKASNIGFYDMGAGATGNTDHILFLAHLLEASNVKSVIFSNEPNGLYNFPSKRPEVQLEAIVILEKWREQYPELRGYIDAYMNRMYHSSGYYKAIANHMKSKRAAVLAGKVEKAIALYRKDEAGGDALSEFRKRKPPYNEPESYEDWRNDIDDSVFPRGYFVRPSGGSAALNLIGGERKCSLLRDYFVCNYSLVRSVDDAEWDRMTVENLNMVADNYLDPSFDVPFIMKTEGWELELAGELPERKKSRRFNNFDKNDTILWLHILGGICKARGIQLIIYYPPDYSITPDLYTKVYKPRFIDVMTRIVEPYSPIVIDHTGLKALNQCDVYLEGTPYKKGHHTNMVGTFKKARSLLDSLHKHGLIEANRNDDISAWGGESRLPDVKFRVVPYVAETSRE